MHLNWLVCNKAAYCQISPMSVVPTLLHHRIVVIQYSLCIHNEPHKFLNIICGLQTPFLQISIGPQQDMLLLITCFKSLLLVERSGTAPKSTYMKIGRCTQEIHGPDPMKSCSSIQIESSGHLSIFCPCFGHCSLTFLQSIYQ